MVSFDALINKAYYVYFRLTSVPADFKAYLSNKLNAGVPVDQVLADLFRAPTVRDEVLPIMRLYRAAFGRKADAAGLDLWAGILRGMGGGAYIVPFMETYWAATPEYTSRFPSNMSTTFFAQKLYTDLLGRNGTANEISVLVGYLDSGQWSRPGAIARFSASQEFIALYDAAFERQLKAAFRDDPNAYAGGLVDHDVAS